MGGVAQMVERSLSMREVPGSIPGASNIYFLLYDTQKQLPEGVKNLMSFLRSLSIYVITVGLFYFCDESIA